MATASRSSVRAFFAEQGGRRLGEVARLWLRVELCKTGCGESWRARLLERGGGVRGRGKGGGNKDLLSDGEKFSLFSTEEGFTGGKGHTGGNNGCETKAETESSSGPRRRRRAARLDATGDRSGVAMPLDRVGAQSRPGAKREAGASQGDNRFMTRSIKWSGITKSRWV